MELSGDNEMTVPTHGAHGGSAKLGAYTGTWGKAPGVTPRGVLPEERPSAGRPGQSCLSLTKDDVELSFKCVPQRIRPTRLK